MINLLDFDEAGLRSWLQGQGESPFRAQQLLRWMHRDLVSDFSEMYNISMKFREKLKDIAQVPEYDFVKEHISSDGTIKWLMTLDTFNAIETVYIPESNRGTLCISSQIGCALDCSFCATGKQGFNRNLSTAEIIAQLRQAIKRLKVLYPERQRAITNVVMMGMGEPLANEKNVFAALSLMIHPLAYGLAQRKVTLSTSGLVPAMLRFKDALPVSLAVSLHAPNDALRDELVPINRKFPLAKLMQACQAFIQSGRGITYEYVCLQDVNDSNEHARQLAKLLHQAPGKVNLIPFNPFEKTQYQTSSWERILEFQRIVKSYGWVVTIRQTRGDDQAAACGQLTGKVANKRAKRLTIQPLVQQ